MKARPGLPLTAAALAASLMLGVGIVPAQEASVDRPDAVQTDEARRAEVDQLQPAVDVGARPSPEAEARSTRRPTMDSLDLGTTSITGNQELPKVLYIVPWKQSDIGELMGRPVNTLLDEVLSPVDPEEFERHLGYYRILHNDESDVTATGQQEEE